MPVGGADSSALRARAARWAGALAILCACSRPDPDKAPGAAPAPLPSASTSASPTTSASAPTDPAERFLGDTGLGEDRTAGAC